MRTVPGGRDGRQVLWRRCGAQVAEHVGALERRRTLTRQLDGEQTYVAEAVDDAGVVEVEA